MASQFFQVAVSETKRGHLGADGPLSYQAKLHLNTKVLDFVKSGGPILTVGSTILEMRLGLRGSPRSAASRFRQGAMGAGAHA